MSLHQQWKPPKCLPFFFFFFFTVFLLRPGNTIVIYNLPSSSCSNVVTIILQVHVLYLINSFKRNPAKNNRRSLSGSGHENGGIHWVFLIPFFLLLIQVLSSPTDTVLMLVTYHRNFCSHHGHHLCRGKIGDMMAFPLSQLRAQSSPTSPSVCTPARVYDYGENVSHEESVSLSHYRCTERLGSSDWTIRQVSIKN